MKVLLTGGTGFVGSEVLRQALAQPSIAQAVSLSRRPGRIVHEKLKEIILADFTDYSSAAAELGADACVWCLGASQTEVSEAEYVRITFDYALAAAKAMWKANPRLRFCFLSGSGADPEEKSRLLFGRLKGRTERELSQLNPEQVFHFRPAFIRPAYPGQKRPWVPRLFVPVAAVMDLFSENVSVGCAQLARCLLDVAQHGAPAHLLDNRAIKRWGQPSGSGLMA